MPLLVYWVASKLIQMHELKRGPSGHGLLIAFVFFLGVRGTFALKRGNSEPGDERYQPPPTAT